MTRNLHNPRSKHTILQKEHIAAHYAQYLSGIEYYLLPKLAISQFLLLSLLLVQNFRFFQIYNFLCRIYFLMLSFFPFVILSQSLPRFCNTSASFICHLLIIFSVSMCTLKLARPDRRNGVALARRQKFHEHCLVLRGSREQLERLALVLY